MAVRQGFEPWVPFNGYNALAKRRFRPLSHLTELFTFCKLRRQFDRRFSGWQAVFACSGAGGGFKSQSGALQKSVNVEYRNTHGAYFWRFAVDGKQINAGQEQIT
jgi:hypothetical protein